MLIKNIFKQKFKKDTVHGGKGILQTCRPYMQSDFSGPWHFIDYAVLPPGTSIGPHKHENNEELYLIIEGAGIMQINGETHRVEKGDIIVNKPYSEHGLINDSDENLCVFVVEIGCK